MGFSNLLDNSEAIHNALQQEEHRKKYVIIKDSVKKVVRINVGARSREKIIIISIICCYV